MMVYGRKILEGAAGLLLVLLLLMLPSVQAYADNPFPEEMLNGAGSDGSIDQPVTDLPTDIGNPNITLSAGACQLLVNKNYTLRSNYSPDQLVYVSNYLKSASGIRISAEAGEALGKMITAMKAKGITDIYANSAYRDYSKQSTLFSNKVAQYRAQGYSEAKAKELAGQIVAPPGTSEHQTGLAIDFSTASLNYGLNNSFAATAAGKWLYENSWKYGFILRYPKDKTDVTGYSYESWHFRYVGAPHAEYITKNKLTFDEYIGELSRNGLLTYTLSDGNLYAVYYSNYDNSALLSGNVLAVSAAKAGTGDYLITTIQAENQLVDISGHWGEGYIRQLADTGIIVGYTDHTFRPNKNITKAELTTMVSRLLSLLTQGQENVEEEQNQQNDIVDPPLMFVDIADSDYYYQAVWICYNAGLLDPSLYTVAEDGTMLFAPGEIMRRKQVAVMLAGLFSEEEAEIDVLPAAAFPDMMGQEQNVIHAADLLVFCSIITGDNMGYFNPEGNITRAEICTIFSRIINHFTVTE